MIMSIRKLVMKIQNQHPEGAFTTTAGKSGTNGGQT